MIDQFFAIKKEMMGRYDRAGRRLSVTRLSAPGCVVVQLKTKDKDGYAAVQLGWGEKKSKNISKPVLGHLAKAGVKGDQKTLAFLGEVRVEDEGTLSDVKVGERVLPSAVLTAGDVVCVRGVSKGKGFAGVVKRHGFAGGPATHGQSDRHRAPGSIGSGTDPGRVWPGQKMAGHMGQEGATVKNLVVLKVDDRTGEVWVSGGVPGGRGAVVRIERTGKLSEFHPVLEVGEGFSMKEAAEEQAQMEQGLGQVEEGEGEAGEVKKEEGK